MHSALLYLLKTARFSVLNIMNGSMNGSVNGSVLSIDTNRY